MLRARDDSFGGSPDRVRVINLLDHAAEGRVQLQAHHTARGQLATGITFTALTGIGMITGITLTGTGCSAPTTRTMGKAGHHHDGRLRAVLAGSIWLILDSQAARRGGAPRRRPDADGAPEPAAPSSGARLRRRHLLSRRLWQLGRREWTSAW